MKTLSVVRHAHAEDAPPGLDDRDRALSLRGQQETTLAAARFAAARGDADRILASPVRRARATAEAFAQALGFDARAVEYDDRLYLAGRDTLFDVLRGLESWLQHVIVIGHNPGMSDFVRALTADDSAGELATAAVRSFRCDIDDWQALGEGSGAPADE